MRYASVRLNQVYNLYLILHACSAMFHLAILLPSSHAYQSRATSELQSLLID